MYAFFQFGYFFVALCIFVFLCIILTNLFLKSYKPQNTLVFIGVIMLVFFVNSILAYNSMQDALRRIRSADDNPTPSSIPQNQNPRPVENEEGELDFF